MDSDYESPRDGYAAAYARHPLQTTHLQLSSHRLIGLKSRNQDNALEATAAVGFGLENEAEKHITDREEHERLGAPFSGSLNDIVTNLHSTMMDYRPHDEGDKPQIEAVVTRDVIPVLTKEPEQLAQEVDQACDIPDFHEKI